MKSSPLVSVIVPAYNAEKFIEETVQSALAQTYSHLEVIVVDDGSTDRTGAVVQSIMQRDSRVKYIFQKNAGQSAARNTALKEARGEYVAFLDADDLFLPEKLARQVEFLEEHPEYGVCYCKIYHFINGRPDQLYYFQVDHPSGSLFPDVLLKNFINPLTVVLRKKLLDQYGAFEPTFRRVDEQFLWVRLAFRKVQFYYLDMPLGLYRVHPGSLSNERLYFKETEEYFLNLLNIVESWMTAEERRQYNLEALRRRTRRRIIIGKLMIRQNPFSRILFWLYQRRRQGRFTPIKGGV